MKSLNRGMKLVVNVATIISFCLLNISPYIQPVAGADEITSPQSHRKVVEAKDSTPSQSHKKISRSEEKQQAKEANYAPGKLIVKLKEGATVYDIQDINNKYNVSSMEKLFKEVAPAEETLKQLKDKLASLSVEHQGWYWQLDKNSQEYKDYAARIEKEKGELQKQIEAKEKLIAHLAQRQKRAPKDAVTPELSNIYVLKTTKDADILAIAKEYSSNPAVEYAEPDYKVKINMVPNDPYYSSSGSWGQSYGDLWGLKKIQASQAWDITQGGGVIVAVVDTGIDYTHEDIASNIWVNSGEISGNNIDDDGNGYVDDTKGYDFAHDDETDYDNDPMDDMGHGTHVAGIVAATGNNSVGIIGVAPKAKVMAAKGLDNEGEGYDSNLANCLTYAADNGADVINNSWGGEGSSSVLKDAVDYVYSKGCVVVAAAGNETVDVYASFPANISNVIAVSAIDSDDEKSDFSNYGVKIDVAAPGGGSTDENDSIRKYENILSLRTKNTDMMEYKNDDYNIIDDNYYRARGTSMAATYVSGLAALILAKHNNFSNDEIKQTIRVSADDIDSTGFDINTGFGRINAYQALQVNSVCTAKITSPKEKKIFKTKTISIKGTASGADFINYKLEYAADAALTSWTQIGSIIYSQVTEGVLINWTPETTGLHYLRLTVTDKNNRHFQDIIGPIFIYKNLHNGWPKYIEGTTQLTSPFTVADVNNDQKQEIIIGDNYGAVYIFKEDGSYLNGWPIAIEDSGTISSDIVLADIDKDNHLEIFFVCDNRYVYAYHDDGTAVNGWPQRIQEDEDYIFFTVAIGDVDNNTSLNIIVMPSGPGWGDKIHYTYIYNTDGTLFKKWPLYDTYDASSSIIKRNELNWEGGLSIGDIDNDGDIELLVALVNAEDSECAYIYIFDYEGAIIKSLKAEDVSIYKSTNGNKSVHPLTTNRPVLADLNNDGEVEIIFSGKTFDSAAAKLFIWSYDGGEFIRTLMKSINGVFPSRSLSVGNVDSDENLEIILGLNKDDDSRGSFICALDSDGTELWRTNTLPASYLSASPIIGDINNDSMQEILILDDPYYDSSYLQLLTYKHDGSLGSIYEMPGDYSFDDGSYNDFSSPTLADIDNDGRVEVIAVSPKNGCIVVWDKTGMYDSSAMDWPMFQHDIYRSGNYDYKIRTADPTDSETPNGTLTINGGATVTNTTAVTLTLSAMDDVGVTGYYLSTNSIVPSASAGGWKSVSPTKSYTANVDYALSTGDGNKTLYCWYKNAAGNISNTASDNIILDTVAPTISITSPTSDDTYIATSGKITLEGNASDSLTGIKSVAWSNNKGESGTAVGTTSWNISSIDLRDGGDYVITVTASDDAGNTKIDTITVTSPYPAAPSNLKATVLSSTSVELTWQDNSSNETEFKIMRSSTTSNNNAFSAIGRTTSVRYTDTGLSAGATYYYKIKAYQDTKYNNDSDIVSVTPTGSADDLTKPSGSISINSGASYAKTTAVTLGLSASDSVGVTGYYLSTSSTTPSASASGWIAITSTTSYRANVSYSLSTGDGSKTIYVWYKDAAGNVSSTASDSITLDTTAPTLSITSPTSSSTYTSTSATISLGGNASDSGSGISAVTWNNDKGGSGTASGTTGWTVSNISLSSGDNKITVTAKDGAGNTSTDTITVAYSPMTTTKPTGSVSINSGADYANSSTGQITLNLSATDDEGVKAYYFMVYTGSTKVYDSGWQTFSATKNYSGSVTHTLSSGDNMYTVYVWYLDINNNMSNQASDSIRWDTTNPNVNITSPTSSTTYTSTSSLITLGGNASDSGSGLETTMSWTSDNQNNPAGTGSITSLGGWTASGIELNSVGTTTITITVKDKAGNKASDTILVTYASSSDTSAPSSTSISINGGSSYTKSTSVTLSLSAADSVGVTGYYLSTSSTKPTASALSGWTSVSSTTSYRANVSYSLSTGDGSKTVYVFYKDAAGNVSSGVNDSITLDTTAPTVSISSPTTSASYAASSSPLSIGGSASDSSGIQKVTWSNTLGGSGIASGTTSWSASIALISSTSSNFIMVTATDNAGNTAMDTLTVSFNVDTSAPSSTSISINGGSSYTKSTSVTLNLSAADSVGVTGYYLSTSSTKPTASALSGWTSVSSTTSYRANVSYSLSTGDGSKTVYVFYKDAAGNVSSGVNDSITLDTTAPTVSITSPAANPYPTSSSSITISGTALDSGSGISNVYWSNSATGLGANLGKVTSFTLSNVSLKKGVINVITVWANDGVLNTGKKELIVLYP